MVDVVQWNLVYVNVRGLSADKPDHVSAIVEGLQSSLSSVYDGHRVAVVSFYSEVSLRLCACL